MEIIETIQNVVTAINAVIFALIGLFLLIPGEEPEKTFRKIGDILAKISRK